MKMLISTLIGLVAVLCIATSSVIASNSYNWVRPVSTSTVNQTINITAGLWESNGSVTSLIDPENIDMQDKNITNTLVHLYNTTGCTEDTVEGTVCWNADYYTLNVVSGLGNVYQVGQELTGVGRNVEGSIIYAGQVVYLVGSQGEMPIVALADGSNGSKINNPAVVTIPQCNINAACPVTTFGYVHDLNTSMWSEGDALYLSDDGSGNLTNVPVSFPNYNIHMGTVVRSHGTNGIILVLPTLDYGNGVTINDVYVRNNLTVAKNVTALEYYFGQPLDGAMDSGIIYASQFETDGNVNLTHLGGLDIGYPNMTVRLARTDNIIQYCNITNNTVSVPDDAHTVYYVDSTCTVQNVPIATWLTTDLTPGGATEIFNVMAHSNEAEVHQGVYIQNKVNIKLRKNTFYTNHLRTVSGLGIVEEIFPDFVLNSGQYTYVLDIVSTSTQNTSAGDKNELFWYNGTDWEFSDSEGLNLTHCQDGLGSIALCNNPTQYRRYYIYVTGFTDGDDNTEIHQEAADQDTTYSNIGNCLNTLTNPISYNRPSFYEYTAVPLYAYCGRAADTDWTGSFIDLRDVITGGATSDIDTSIFLTRDGTRSLTDDWNAGDYNISITEWFNGQFNWTTNTSYLNFDGTTLEFNETKLLDTETNCNATGSCSPNILYSNYNNPIDRDLILRTNETGHYIYSAPLNDSGDILDWDFDTGPNEQTYYIFGTTSDDFYPVTASDGAYFTNLVSESMGACGMNLGGGGLTFYFRDSDFDSNASFNSWFDVICGGCGLTCKLFQKYQFIPTGSGDYYWNTSTGLNYSHASQYHLPAEINDTTRTIPSIILNSTNGTIILDGNIYATNATFNSMITIRGAGIPVGDSSLQGVQYVFESDGRGAGLNFFMNLASPSTHTGNVYGQFTGKEYSANVDYNGGYWDIYAQTRIGTAGHRVNVDNGIAKFTTFVGGENSNITTANAFTCAIASENGGSGNITYYTGYQDLLATGSTDVSQLYVTYRATNQQHLTAPTYGIYSLAEQNVFFNNTGFGADKTAPQYLVHVGNTSGTNISIWADGEVHGSKFVTHTYFPEEDVTEILMAIRGENGKPIYDTFPDDSVSISEHKHYSFEDIEFEQETEHCIKLLKEEYTMVNPKLYTESMFYESCNNITTESSYRKPTLEYIESKEGIAIDVIVPMLIKGFQEQQAYIQQLESRIEKLENAK